MKILAFDTTMNACSVAVWSDGNVLSSENKKMSRGQAEALVPMIEKNLNIAGVNYSELSMIAVTTGPGSFTGIRAGLSTAKAIGFAADVPVCGISTARVVAGMAAEKGIKDIQNIAVVLETKRPDIYFQLFDNKLNPLSELDALMPFEIEKKVIGTKTLLAGDASERVFSSFENKEDIEKITLLPDAAKLAEIASVHNPNELKEYPLPLYIKAPNVRIPKKN